MAKGEKTGGRKKGTPNKTTQEIRDKFSLLLSNNIDTLQNDINQLEPKDRIKTLIDISKFVIPTLKATELKMNNEDNQDNEDKRVQIVFKEITKEHVKNVINKLDNN